MSNYVNLKFSFKIKKFILNSKSLLGWQIDIVLMKLMLRFIKKQVEVLNIIIF